MANASTAFSSSNEPAPGVSGLTAGVIAPTPLVYGIPLVCGLVLQYWYPRAVVAHGLAAPVGIACVLLGLVGLPAIRAFRRAKTSPKPWRPSTALVTTGPYRFSRNPMYVGMTLLYAGVAIWVNAIWPLLFLPLGLVVMQVWSDCPGGGVSRARVRRNVPGVPAARPALALRRGNTIAR